MGERGGRVGGAKVYASIHFISTSNNDTYLNFWDGVNEICVTVTSKLTDSARGLIRRSSSSHYVNRRRYVYFRNRSDN